MTLNSESKFLIIVTLLTAAIVGIGILIFSKPQTQTSESPTLSREQLITETTATKGNKDAAHFLVEFSDFQCPACKGYQPTVDEIVNANSDKLLFAYRHFPLDQHPFALSAAQAAVAAQKQNKFWEMYGLLFENQESLSDSVIEEQAKKLELNIDQYKNDFNSAKDLVFQDRAFGLQIGVNSTPTFYLDGKKLLLKGPSDLKTQVEAALQD